MEIKRISNAFCFNDECDCELSVVGMLIFLIVFSLLLRVFCGMSSPGAYRGSCGGLHFVSPSEGYALGFFAGFCHTSGCGFFWKIPYSLVFSP